MRGGLLGGWNSPHGNSGRACGTSLQIESKNFTPTRRGQLGHLGGRRPLASSTVNTGSNIDYTKWECRDGSDYAREEAEAEQCHRPARRHGVSSTTRRYASSLASEVPGCSWRTSRRGSGADKRATLSVVQTDLRAEGCAVHGLRNLRAVWKETAEISKIQGAHLDFAGLCDEGNSRPSKFCDVEGFLSGVQNGDDHVGRDQCCQPDGIRSLHRTYGDDLPYSLAFGNHGRGHRESRAYDENKDETGSIFGRWWSTPSKMGPYKAMGLGAEVVDGGREVLERSSTYSSLGMDGSGCKRDTKVPSRKDVSQLPEGRHGVHYAPCGEESQESFDGKEEEETRQWREGGPRVPEGKRWRIPRKWRKVQRKRKRAKGCPTMLCLERQHGPMCRTVSRDGMQGAGEERTPLHEVQVSWASSIRVPVKETMMSVAGLTMAGASKKEGEDQVEKGFEEGQAVKKGTRNKSDPRKEGERCGEAEQHEEGSTATEMMTLEEYIANRVFVFVHHFSGPRDPLGEAIRAQAGDKMRVRILAVDREKTGEDLSAEEPYHRHLAMAREGLVDGFHAGFPCATFSKLRWRKSPNMPGPVRSKQHPYGFESNNTKEQRECDMGTVLAARSVKMALTVKDSRSARVRPFSTLENPPPSGEADHLSAWELPEVQEYTEQKDVVVANFHTCAFQQGVKYGERNYKPQQLAGNLYGLNVFGSQKCQCGEGVKHDPIVGPEKSKRSAEYPQNMCKLYATLAIQHWQRMAKEEYYKMKMERLRGEIEKGKKEKERKRKPERDEEEDNRPQRIRLTPAQPSEWVGDPNSKHGLLRAMKSKKEGNDQEVYVGGMKNPAVVVRGMPTLQSLGMRVWAAWESFIKGNRKALNVAEEYGSLKCEYDQKVLESWRAKLRMTLGARSPPISRRSENIPYRSPLDPELISAWVERGGDPETEVVTWIHEGTPLGMAKEIKSAEYFQPQ